MKTTPICPLIVLSRVLLSMIALLPAIVSAQVNYAKDTFFKGVAYVTNSPHASGFILIKDYYQGYPVTTVGNGAFQNCTELVGVIIPEGITDIGFVAFAGCSSLSEVTIPNSLTSIDTGAFDRCSSLTSLTIPNNVTYIGSLAFRSCSSLTRITIPNSVVSLAFDAFTQCSGLTGIDVEADNPNYSSVDGVLFDKTGQKLLICPGGLSGSYSIPDGVGSIGNRAFRACSSLTSLTIPNSVTNIGDRVFVGCSSLKSIEVMAGNPSFSSVDGVLFDKQGGTLLTCPGGLSGGYSIPSGVTNLGDYSFAGCSSLTSVTIPNSVTNLGDYSLAGCSSLTSISIPDGVSKIGVHDFDGCTSLTRVTIPNSVTSIGINAFYGCSSLSEVTIPNSVSSIGAGAFVLCSGLTSITIPDSVTFLGEYAFDGASSLMRILFQGNAPRLGILAFRGIRSDATVYYLPGTIGWSSNFGGVPTAVLPQISLTDLVPPSDGAPFSLTVHGAVGDTVVLDATDDLITWVTLSTLTLSDAVTPVSDPDSSQHDHRYYRLRFP